MEFEARCPTMASRNVDGSLTTTALQYYQLSSESGLFLGAFPNSDKLQMHFASSSKTQKSEIPGSSFRCRLCRRNEFLRLKNIEKRIREIDST